MKFLFLVLALYPLARFCHHQTKGFRCSKLTDNFCCTARQPCKDMPQHLRALCNQPFTYLGRGLQSFSFASEDGTLVLKLFNNRYRRLLLLLRLPLVRILKKGCIAQLEAQWMQTFSSYTLAAQLLRDETGLLFLHMSPCESCPRVTIIDPLGSPHLIDLSQYAFALQKRAEGSFAFFRTCMQTNDLDLAKKGLVSLAALIKRKAELGLIDHDPLIRTNIGFLDGKAIQIDLGPFSQATDPIDQQAHKREMERILSQMRPFMQSQTPTLLPLLDRVIDQL